MGQPLFGITENFMKKISLFVALLFLLTSCNLQAADQSLSPTKEDVSEETEVSETENGKTDGLPEESETAVPEQTDEALSEEQQVAEEVEAELTVIPEIIFDERDTVFVMQVGGTDISYAAFSYYLDKVRKAYPFSSPELWEEMALFEIKCDVATELLASMHSVEMSEEYKKEFVDGVILNTFNTYNGIDSVSYQEALSIFNMTDLFFRQLQENSVLRTLIYNECFSPESGAGYASEENILSHIHEDYIRIKHILVSTADLDDAGKAVAKKKAEEILALARQGEPFEELVSVYSDDSMDPYVGYYITHDVTVIELEEKGFEMSVGAISDLVESPYGYHIIKKYPLDDEYVLATGSIRASAEKDLCEKAFYDELYETAKMLGIVYYDNYSHVLSELLQ